MDARRELKLTTRIDNMLFYSFGGAVAQLGERLNGIQEVVGSIPISSTINFHTVSYQTTSPPRDSS
jgi:hypothetical protein